MLAMLVFALWRTPTFWSVLLGSTFAAVYLAGTLVGRRALLSAGPTLPSQSTDRRTQIWINLWLLLIIVLWSALAFAAPDAAYLSFPLFFLAMHVASGRTGFLAVIAMTAVAVIAIAVHHGWTTGGVLGPIIGGVVAMVTGFGVHLLLVESHARAQAIRELTAAKADIAEISRRAGENDERARLAADIHDTVAQGLSSVQLLLHAAERKLQGPAEDPSASAAPSPEDIEAALERIRLARDTAGENLAETRRILRQLQPAPLADSALPVALARVCATAALADPVEFSVTGDPQPLSGNAEETIIRVAQSVVANAVKHSEADQCSVSLEFAADSTRLIVEDNGIGFDPTAEADEDSMGLAIAHRRASDAGGNLTINSSPGHGCRITLTIPEGA